MESRLLAELPRLRPYLRGLAARSGGATEADELEQEVVTRALRSRDRYDRSRAIGPWLRTTAFRAFLDLVRRRRAEPHSLDADDPALARPAAAALGERREMVELLLRGLPELEQEVLRRFHLEEQSVREIAAALAMPTGTVKSHLHRARRKLAAGAEPEWREA